jgi:hypothetical protein
MRSRQSIISEVRRHIASAAYLRHVRSELAQVFPQNDTIIKLYSSLRNNLCQGLAQVRRRTASAAYLRQVR